MFIIKVIRLSVSPLELYYLNKRDRFCPYTPYYFIPIIISNLIPVS